MEKNINKYIVKYLDKSEEHEYDSFLLKSERTMFYATTKFKHLICDALCVEPYYSIACADDGAIVGALPAICMRNVKIGNVLNSLPFYGSNGGVIEYSGNHTVQKILIDQFVDTATRLNCVSSTIITSPFDVRNDHYTKYYDHNYMDSRVGQITELPHDGESLEASLMCMYDAVRRRNIRKAKKNCIEVTWDDSEAPLEYVMKEHARNMEAMGGKAKPGSFFKKISKYFRCGDDYRIYVARMNGKYVAALLLFYFNKTVEYYTPVIDSEYRTYQPLSLLIYEAMRDAARRGFRWWNWGGTWKEQKGVYQFKTKWGAEDKDYYYYTKIYDDRISQYESQKLLDEYPFFYVVPFHVLSK